jgi:hypothetical protein
MKKPSSTQARMTVAERGGTPTPHPAKRGQPVPIPAPSLTHPAHHQTPIGYPPTNSSEVVTLDAEGYEYLAHVLGRAFDQAAIGKGHQRHANGEPFHEQVMQDGARRFGTGALLFQAYKKAEESQRLPHERAVAELLGSIVYLAGAVISLERENAKREQLP